MSRKTTSYATKRGLHRTDKSRKPKSLKGNGIAANNLHNTPFTQAELDWLLHEPREALAAARTGRISYNDLVSLSSAMHKGIAIEDARTIIRGFAPIYQRANAVISAIEARCSTTGRWVPGALYGPELAALDDLLFAYREALKVCTYGEFYRRQAVALARTASRGLPVFTAGDVLQYPGRKEAAT
jgi:hypothetical protein